MCRISPPMANVKNIFTFLYFISIVRPAYNNHTHLIILGYGLGNGKGTVWERFGNGGRDSFAYVSKMKDLLYSNSFVFVQSNWPFRDYPPYIINGEWSHHSQVMLTVTEAKHLVFLFCWLAVTIPSLESWHSPYMFRPLWHSPRD